MPYRVLFKGGECNIVHWAPREKDLLMEFCGCPQLSGKDKKKLVQFLDRVARCGLPKNKEKYRHVEGKICELKPTNQLRLLGFNQENSFVVLFCIRKKKDKLSAQDKKRAQDLLEQHDREE
jgi:phage-related protein